MKMIDSIVLELREGQFEVVDKTKLDGSNTKKVANRYSVSTIFSMLAEEYKKKGIYFPAISLPTRKDSRKSMKTLEIQVSLPKLLYGTNLFEVDETHLDELCRRLALCLRKIGINALSYDIKHAVVRRVDYSKAIIIPEHYGTAKQIIKRLRNFDYKPSSDFHYRDDYTNADGAMLKFWDKTQGYAVYDKASEIVANGKTKIEKELIETIEAKKISKKMIKFELSLQRKQSMDAVLRRRFKTKQKDFTFQQVMENKGAAKYILLKVFDSIFGNTNVAIITLTEMRENMLEQLLLQKELNINKHALLHYSVNMAIKFGINAMWSELKGRMPPATFSRYKKELSKIIANLGELPENIQPIIKFLRQKHEQFEIIKANPQSYNL
jgi:hypothetical protein